jgi:hypothetical protein
MLSLQASLFMLIHICHPIKDDCVSKTMITDFLECNYRRRQTFLNLSSLQSILSTIDGERGTKILYQIFMDKEPEFKKSIDTSRSYSELMHVAGPKSKSGSGNLETATYHVRMFHALGGRP